MATRKTVKPAAKTVSKTAPAVVASTPVRNTAVPPKASVAKAKPVVTHDQIAVRAYEIWTRTGGSEQDNWAQAERELRSL